MWLRLVGMSLAAAGLTFTASCGGPQAVRGEQVEGLDQQAFGTGLDKHDLQKLMHENMTAFEQSAALQRWRREGRPTVAVLPFRNDTSEHVDSALDALISDVETALINAGEVRVISLEHQPQLIQEVRRQYSDGFDPQNVSAWGRQVGARYFVTGKVFSADERSGDERRVQYFMFMQILDAETGDIMFQNKSNLTKAIVR